MNRGQKWLRQFRLSLLFAAVMFLLLLATVFVVFLLMMLTVQLGIFNITEVNRLPLFIFAISSIIIGTVMAFVFSNKPLKPLRIMMDATDRIATGDYSVRIKLGGPDEFQLLAEKFNHMSQELGSVEMLRSDFVNNFSHELKTPITSIRGFAKMLKCEDLTPKERDEYLDIIINESERLCDLSANVLTLSKYEQQTILTDVAPFNLTEQLRQTVALLYSRWNEKDLEILFSADEFIYSGNREMLGQVWINLLDNAIKFSPDGSIITITAEKTSDTLSICFTDQGVGMSPETANRVFDKFYQGDAARSTNGNGLGLAIAKRIIELHGGSIDVESKPGEGATFVVTFPQIELKI